MLCGPIEKETITSWSDRGNESSLATLPLGSNYGGMSTVQEIEAALSRLAAKDLEAVEKTIYRLKHQGQDEEGFEYLQREYGITREEWARFVRQREKEIEADRAHGRLKLFTGDIEQDLQD